MCTFSMIADDWIKRRPEIQTLPSLPALTQTQDPALKKQVADLRKEVTELKDLLRAAKKYDSATGQPDCELQEKVEIIRRVADLVGVPLDDI